MLQRVLLLSELLSHVLILYSTISLAVPKHHRLDDQDSSNYQRLQALARLRLPRAIIGHIGANNLVSCCLQRVPVQWHQLPHSKSQHDDADQRAMIDLLVYQAPVLQADAHLSQRSHRHVVRGCVHAFATTQDYLDRVVIAPQASAIEGHHLLSELQSFQVLSRQHRCQANVGAQIRTHFQPMEDSEDKANTIQLGVLADHRD